MKKQIASILTLALILCSLTACQEGGAEDLPGAQDSVTDSTVSDNDNSSSDPESSSSDSESSTSDSESSTSDPESSSTNKGDDSAPESSDSTPDEPKEMGIYGETEIPDIPCGNPDYEGKANYMDPDETAKSLEQCLDSIVFETHTYGEYTISLIGERVRTDKANFPDSIYVEALSVDVRRNGEKIGEHKSYYTGSGMLTYLSMGYTEFRLFTDKIGNYLDFYELDTPVIAMRYYYKEDEGREVTKAVGFATIGEDEIYDSLWGTCEKGTGITFNPDSIANDPASELAFNAKDCGCAVSRFAADKFRIADGKTLVDDEAGVKYTFDFSDPYELEGVVYKTEWIK